MQARGAWAWEGLGWLHAEGGVAPLGRAPGQPRWGTRPSTACSISHQMLLQGQARALARRWGGQEPQQHGFRGATAWPPPAPCVMRGRTSPTYRSRSWALPLRSQQGIRCMMRSSRSRQRRRPAGARVPVAASETRLISLPAGDAPRCGIKAHLIASFQLLRLLFAATSPSGLRTGAQPLKICAPEHTAGRPAPG
jgi:hypothetical protein